MWWAIQFSDNSAGYMKMSAENACDGVYRADGTLISPEEHIEYTCIDMNAVAPSWAI